MKAPLDNFLARPTQVTTHVVRLLGLYEKVILALLAVVIVTSGTFWYRQFSLEHDGGPGAGGSYVEGIIGDDQEVRQLALRLTRVGLFGFDPDGKLENILVKDWEVNAEKTEYTFALKDKVDKNEILTDLQNSSELLGSANVEQDDQGRVVISLTEANPNLPLILAQPLFDYGPYKLSKATDKTTIFSRNPREGAVLPYLNKVIVHTYSDKDQLQQALEKRKLDGAVAEGVTLPHGYTLQSFELPRFYAVIFNLNKSPFREVGLRSALFDDSAVPATPFTLTVADQEPNKTLAAEAAKQWEQRGAKVTLEVKPAAEIQDKIGPSRTFQALLTGIDYGIELDPTYLWASSQIRPPGNNLGGVKSLAVDAQIEAIKATTDLGVRTKSIKALHEQLTSDRVALFVRQETVSFAVKDSIVFRTPWLAQSAADRYRSTADWYIK